MRHTRTAWTTILAAVAIALLASRAHAQQPLATASIQLLGLRLQVAADVHPCPHPDPSKLCDQPIQVPTNATFPLSTQVVRADGAAVSPAAVFDAHTLQVHGHLYGDGIDTELDPVGLGESLQIPLLARAGTYFLDGLYLTGDDPLTGVNNRLLDADPSVIEIRALEQIFVSSVSSRQLTLEEIQDRGILIDPSNFNAVEFTFGIATSSNQVPISFPMFFPKDQPYTRDQSGSI